MKVLITGGTGFIGSALCRSYLGDGHDVRTLTKIATAPESDSAERLRQSGVEILEGDVARRDDVAKAVDGIDLVIHVAAAMRESNISDLAYHQVNVEGTRYVLEKSLRAGVRHMVHVSSVGVYGDISGRRVKEDSPCRPNNIYGVTKLKAEQVVLDFVRRESLPVVIVRPAEVYGSGDFRLLKLFRMIEKRRFIMFGSGRGRHHLIYIDDLVAAIKQAAERPDLSGKTFILAGNEPVALNDLVSEIARQLGVKKSALSLPLAPMLALAAVVELTCRPLGVQPIIYRRRMDFFRHDWNLDISACKSELGYTPRFDLPAGIHSTIEGYRRMGLLS